MNNILEVPLLLARFSTQSNKRRIRISRHTAHLSLLTGPGLVIKRNDSGILVILSQLLQSILQIVPALILKLLVQNNLIRAFHAALT